MNTRITICELIIISATPEQVWDYTQDYACRPDWDSSIIEGKVTAVSPQRTVRVRGAGGLSCTFRYKVFDRPHRTSLVMEDVRSWLVIGGGGAWRYDAAHGGTRWMQTNTLLLRGGWLARPWHPVLRWMLAWSTRRAMRRAGQRIESGRTAPTRPRTCEFPPTATA